VGTTSDRKGRVGRPADTDSEKTRQQLLAAAANHFARDGYAHATLRGIAQAAGLTAGTLYHHYATKADLYQAVYRYAVDELTAAYAVGLQDSHTFEDQLRVVLRTQINLLARSVPAPLIVARAWVDHALDGTPSVPVESSSRVLIDALVDGAVVRGEIRPEEVTIWRPLVRTMMWGVTMLHLTGAYPAETVIEGVLAKVLAPVALPRGHTRGVY
jgi:AcrR family transcriptional regulator